MSGMPPNQEMVIDPVLELSGALSAMTNEVFAVLDGTYFDRLEEQFAPRTTVRALFLDTSDETVRRDGPWLVSLRSPFVRDRIVERVAYEPCGVFWSCGDGLHALWRHLRTINKIMIPDDRYPDLEGHPGVPSRYERVLFRHWDPNVLATVLPVLDGARLAKLLGPAQSILVNTNADGRVRHSTFTADASFRAGGILSLGPRQIEAIENRTQAAYCARMGAHLRAMAPDETVAMTGREIDERVLRYEASGNSLGIGHERSLALWGFLMLTSGDRFDSKPEIRSFIQAGPGTPDDNVEALVHQMTRLAATFGEVG